MPVAEYSPRLSRRLTGRQPGGQSSARGGREATQWWNAPGQMTENFRYLGKSQYPGTAEVDDHDDAKCEQKDNDLLKPRPISRLRRFGEWISQTRSHQRGDRRARGDLEQPDPSVLRGAAYSAAENNDQDYRLDRRAQTQCQSKCQIA